MKISLFQTLSRQVQPHHVCCVRRRQENPSSVRQSPHSGEQHPTVVGTNLTNLVLTESRRRDQDQGRTPHPREGPGQGQRGRGGGCGARGQVRVRRYSPHECHRRGQGPPPGVRRRQARDGRRGVPAVPRVRPCGQAERVGRLTKISS